MNLSGKFYQNDEYNFVFKLEIVSSNIHTNVITMKVKLASEIKILEDLVFSGTTQFALYFW